MIIFGEETMTDTISTVHDTASSADTSYAAVLEDVAVYDASTYGRLRLSGRNPASLIHRLSTNDVERLTPGDGARTVLINHNARIIDLLTVYALPEHLLVVASASQREAVETLIRKNIFFMDRIVVEDVTEQTVQLHLYGPHAAAKVQEITGIDPQSWPLHHIQAAAFGDGDTAPQGWVARILPLGGDGFALFARAEDRVVLEALLSSVPMLSATTYDVLRIEQGYAVSGHELSLEYIPLETRLTDAISFNKGCYVGQEIIARMDSRQRLAKQLMGLRLRQPVEPGGKLFRDGKEAGDLTSVALSSRFGAIGLGYVRTASAEPGTIVEVADGVQAEVVTLPFG